MGPNRLIQGHMVVTHHYIVQLRMLLRQLSAEELYTRANHRRKCLRHTGILPAVVTPLVCQTNSPPRMNS